MKSILKKGLFALVLAGLFTACSKADESSSKVQNYMQGGDRKAEIKEGFIGNSEEPAGSGITWREQVLSFVSPGLSLVYTSGDVDTDKSSGVGDACAIYITTLNKEIVPGTYQFGTSDDKSLIVEGTYMQDYDVVESGKHEGGIAAYKGTITKGVVRIEKRDSNYTIEVNGECTDKKGVVKMLTLRYQGSLRAF